MSFRGDYHTHTFYSDGINTAERIILTARKLKYDEVAITDHGCANKFGGLTPKKIDKLAKELELLRVKYPDITVYQGYEADIISFDGSVDLYKSFAHKLDVVLLGFHRFITPKRFSEIFTFVLYNGFFARIFGYTKKKIAKNTRALIKAIEDYPIDILAHIGSNMEVEYGEVAAYCAKLGVYVELNIKHLDLMDRVIKEILPTGCMFIADTDSHNMGRVNDMDKIYRFILKHGIPLERVANWDKLPDFKRIREYKDGKAFAGMTEPSK